MVNLKRNNLLNEISKLQILGFKITLSDVAFGDVWLCSGQSNMEMFMRVNMSSVS